MACRDERPLPANPLPGRRDPAEDESYLWPGAVDKASLNGAELVATWPRRQDVPKHLWTELLRQADRNVDYLAYAGLFLSEEHPDWLPCYGPVPRPVPGYGS